MGSHVARLRRRSQNNIKTVIRRLDLRHKAVPRIKLKTVMHTGLHKRQKICKVAERLWSSQDGSCFTVKQTVFKHSSYSYRALDVRCITTSLLSYNRVAMSCFTGPTQARKSRLFISHLKDMWEHVSQALTTLWVSASVCLLLWDTFRQSYARCPVTLC
jgi:hypothetical protein